MSRGPKPKRDRKTEEGARQGLRGAHGSGAMVRDEEGEGMGGGGMGEGGVPTASMLDWVGGEEVRDEAGSEAVAFDVRSPL